MSEVSKKGLADRGGWREEILERPEIQASFLYLFPIPPWEKGDTLLEIFWHSFGGFACRQPPPANPFSKPLKMWVCLICVIAPYSNGAAQLRVGLELADTFGLAELGSYILRNTPERWQLRA